MKSVGETSQKSKDSPKQAAAPNADQSGCKEDEQEAKSKQDNISTGQSQSGREEVKPVKKGGKESGASETAKDGNPSGSTHVKDSTACSDKEEAQPKSTGASAAGGSTPVKALGQKQPGEATHPYQSCGVSQTSGEGGTYHYVRPPLFRF